MPFAVWTRGSRRGGWRPFALETERRPEAIRSRDGGRRGDLRPFAPETGRRPKVVRVGDRGRRGGWRPFALETERRPKAVRARDGEEAKGRSCWRWRSFPVQTRGSNHRHGGADRPFAVWTRGATADKGEPVDCTEEEAGGRSRCSHGESGRLRRRGGRTAFTPKTKAANEQWGQRPQHLLGREMGDWPTTETPVQTGDGRRTPIFAAKEMANKRRQMGGLRRGRTRRYFRHNGWNHGIRARVD